MATIDEQALAEKQTSAFSYQLLLTSDVRPSSPGSSAFGHRVDFSVWSGTILWDSEGISTFVCG